MSAVEQRPTPEPSPLDRQATLRGMFDAVKGTGEPTEEMLESLRQHLEPAQVTDALKTVIVERYKWYGIKGNEVKHSLLVTDEELFFLDPAGGVFTDDYHQRIKLEKMGFAQSAADDKEFEQMSSLRVRRVFGNSTENQRATLRARWYEEFPTVYDELPLLPYAGLRS